MVVVDHPERVLEVRVFDLFPFYKELDLLGLRLEELKSLVTVFGLVELPVTFTDCPKSLHFTKPGKMTQAEYEGGAKIRAYCPSAWPSGVHPTVDWFQRAQLGVHLKDAEPDDIIMISDVDEIPNRDVVRRLIEAGIDEPLCLQFRLYYHRVDLFDPSGPWSGTIIMPYKFFTDAQELRHQRCSLPQIPDAGWHFSWLGDEKAIYDKLQAVDIERDSNDQMKHPSEDPAFLRSCYERGVDLFGRRDHTKVRVPIIPGVNQPHEIVPWLEKHPQYAAMDAVPY